MYYLLRCCQSIKKDMAHLLRWEICVVFLFDTLKNPCFGRKYA